MKETKEQEIQLRQTRVWIQGLEKDINEQLEKMRRKIDDALLQLVKVEQAPPIKIEDIKEPKFLPEEPPSGGRQGGGKERV